MKYKVNVNWLKTGEGDIFTSNEFGIENDILKETIIKLRQLDEDYLKMLNQLIDGMLDKQSKK